MTQISRADGHSNENLQVGERMSRCKNTDGCAAVPNPRNDPGLRHPVRYNAHCNDRASSRRLGGVALRREWYKSTDGCTGPQGSFTGSETVPGVRGGIWLPSVVHA